MVAPFKAERAVGIPFHDFHRANASDVIGLKLNRCRLIMFAVENL